MDSRPARFVWWIAVMSGAVMSGCQGFELPVPGSAEPTARGRSAGRTPTGAELAAFRFELEPMMRRRPLSVRTQARGVTSHGPGQSFDNLALIEIDADGAPQIECVESVAEAESFLMKAVEARER